MKQTISILLVAIAASSCSKSSPSPSASSGTSCVCKVRWMGGSVANPTYRDTTMTYGGTSRSKCDSITTQMVLTYGRAHSGNNYVGAQCDLK